MAIISWVASKVFLKKVWVWLKNYWYVPALLLYTLIMWLVFRRNANDILKVLDASKQSYEKQLEAVDRAHKGEIKERDELILKYQESLKKIEKEYKIRISDLDKKEKEEIAKIVEKNKESPDELAKELAELLGADYVE